MIRVVLTVLVAVALLAASMPAIETARTTTTVEAVDSESDRLERAVAGLVERSSPVSEREMAAQTTRVVRLPTRFTAADVDRIALVETGRRGAVRDRDDREGTSRGDSAGNVDRAGRGDRAARGGTDSGGVAFAFRIDGGLERAVSVGTGPIPVDVELVGGPIELRPTGATRLNLRYVDDEGPTVRVARVG